MGHVDAHSDVRIVQAVEQCETRSARGRACHPQSNGRRLPRGRQRVAQVLDQPVHLLGLGNIRGSGTRQVKPPGKIQGGRDGHVHIVIGQGPLQSEDCLLVVESGLAQGIGGKVPQIGRVAVHTGQQLAQGRIIGRIDLERGFRSMQAD